MLRKGTAFKQSKPYLNLSADIRHLAERIAAKESQRTPPEAPANQS